jgi:hypothetical protein
MTSSTTHAPTPPPSESTEPTTVDVAAWDARAEEPRHAAWSVHHSLEPRGRHRLKQSAVRPPAAALVSGLVYLATAGRVRVGHAKSTLIRSGARRRATPEIPEIPAQQGVSQSLDATPADSAPVDSPPADAAPADAAPADAAPADATPAHAAPARATPVDSVTAEPAPTEPATSEPATTEPATKQPTPAEATSDEASTAEGTTAGSKPSVD